MSNSTGRILVTLAASAFLLYPQPARAGEKEPSGKIHALLINGGSKPSSNYLSHLHHLQDMVELLKRRGLPPERIHVFSADGEESAEDLAVRDLLPDGFWVIEGTPLEGSLRPRTRMTNTVWEGVPLAPARTEALRAWFGKSRELLGPRDRLLLFVTDHGTKNEEDLDNGAISLWQEKLTVEELKKLLDLLPRGVRTVMVMSQCYSGTFESAIYDDPLEPTGGTCGFFSTTRDLPAYGCYPEGRDRDRLGHAFEFIEALERHLSTTEAHREVLVTDTTPDVPLRTSDLYLERLLAARAQAAGETLTVAVDKLLELAWKDRAAWEPEIRLLDRIGNAYGTFSPRTLAELEAYDLALPGLIERMETYSERWDEALAAIKRENLAAFIESRPAWKEKLETEAIKALDREERAGLLLELLPQLESRALGEPGIAARLDLVREKATRAGEARWRLEVRRGALRRMRSILIGVAGRVLVSADTPAGPETGKRREQQKALEDLESCEAIEPGDLPVTEAASRIAEFEPFPPLAEEMKLLEEVLPSWLGVRYGPVPAFLRKDRDLNEGATWLRDVYPDSPALEAGLEAGDIILGPPGIPFSSSGQLREWTMLATPGTPLALSILRPGLSGEVDRSFDVTLHLRPFPLEWPELPGPPQVGEQAPELPAGLEPVGGPKLPDLDGRPHMLFFWATWCLPCKRAVPEVLAYAEANRMRVLAISDEEPETVAGFLEKRDDPFFESVAVDRMRRSFISFGVSGTPTILIIDAQGIVTHRQVGYSLDEGLKAEGWSYSSPAP